MSTEDLEIHLPVDTPEKVQGKGVSSILQTGNGIRQGRRITSPVEISPPSKDEEDGDFSPENVTNASSLKDLETALIRVPVEH